MTVSNEVISNLLFQDYKVPAEQLDLGSVFIVIQARMTSTRLPGKVLLPLCSTTVIEVMFDRLNAFKSSIIVATTNDGTEENLCRVCIENGIRYFKGDTFNVLERCYLTLKEAGAKAGDIVVRCTSDCPVVAPEIVAAVINAKQQLRDFDYVGAGPHSGFPWGIDAAAFSFESLEQAYINAESDYDREHVTPYIGRHYRVAQLDAPEDNSRYRLTLDEKNDYDAIRELYRLLGDRVDFGYEELLRVLEENPHIYELNKHVKQKNT